MAIVAAVPSVIFPLVPGFGAVPSFSWFVGAILGGVHYFISRNDTTLAQSIVDATAMENSDGGSLHTGL